MSGYYYIEIASSKIILNKIFLKSVRSLFSQKSPACVGGLHLQTIVLKPTDILCHAIQQGLKVSVM